MSAKGSELKRVRQSRKANSYNNHYKSMMKTSIKKVLASSSKDDASSLKNEAFKIIDKVASKGVIHKNKAANQKSRISRHLNSLS
ncbi:MAG: 30S ribosomal protein S20 [Candidatus Marinimicrobia bacterium]|nr:30S ribosomal protein S20 [Candidatus Neomarinimicrobiota bacterium]|tara:strand:- start:6015 stop:6269 length:255 start_codon:yes stop_codon:yes gene_type:complete